MIHIPLWERICACGEYQWNSRQGCWQQSKTSCIWKYHTQDMLEYREATSFLKLWWLVIGLGFMGMIPKWHSSHHNGSTNTSLRAKKLDGRAAISKSCQLFFFYYWSVLHHEYFHYYHIMVYQGVLSWDSSSYLWCFVLQVVQIFLAKHKVQAWIRNSWRQQWCLGPASQQKYKINNEVSCMPWFGQS